MKNLRLTFLIPLLILTGCSHPTKSIFHHETIPSVSNNYTGEFGIISGRIGERAVANVSCENYYGVLVPPTLSKSTEEIKYYKYQCIGSKPSNLVDSQNPSSVWCASKGFYTTKSCPEVAAQPAVNETSPQVFKSQDAVPGASYVYCVSLRKMVMEGKEACPQSAKQSTVIGPPAQAGMQNDSVRDLKERLKEAEALEAADKRNKTVEAKQTAVREASEKLAQKQAEADRRRAEKAESERLAAEAKRGDGSTGDIHCKMMKMAPTTPKYLTCRKDFAESEATARVAEQQKRREVEEARRATEEAQRAAEQAKVGDGTPEHDACLKFGFIGNTPPYADCRLRLEMNKQEVAQRQAAYEVAQQRYERQLAAAKREKERQQGLALMQFGAALASSTSPTFAGGIADANRAMGWAPPAPPEPPKLQPFMIQGPKGMTTCTVVGNMYNCF